MTRPDLSLEMGAGGRRRFVIIDLLSRSRLYNPNCISQISCQSVIGDSLAGYVHLRDSKLVLIIREEQDVLS
jgi:hypothetical protein